MPKISWLDSVRMPARIHIAESDGQATLCGYSFKQMFEDRTWIPYRNGKKRGVCSACINIAKMKGIDYKTWHESVPERNYEELPISSKIKQRIKGS